MLDSVVEYITQAASSSAFIFCFCNLIIVIILVDLKPGLKFDQQGKIPLSNIPKNTEIQGTNSKCVVYKHSSSLQPREVSHVQDVAVDKIETGGSESSDTCCNEEEEDDELRRRVEEFIEKVNEGWKAEVQNI